jgi:hypothetical protein
VGRGVPLTGRESYTPLPLCFAFDKSGSRSLREFLVGEIDPRNVWSCKVTLPLEYPYKPKLWIILLTFSSGVAWITLSRSNLRGTALWFGLLPLAVAFLTTLRRVAFRRMLRLDTDGLVVLSGFLRFRPTLVRYVDIERVWETRLPFTVVLSIATRAGKFEVVSSMLPNLASYSEIATFLYFLIGRRLN